MTLGAISESVGAGDAGYCSAPSDHSSREAVVLATRLRRARRSTALAPDRRACGRRGEARSGRTGRVPDRAHRRGLGRHVDRSADPGPARARQRPGSPCSSPPTTRSRCIGATLRALAALDYPADLYRVHVVADHCTDRTVEIARAAGVEVHEHAGERRGQGPGAGAGRSRRLLDARRRRSARTSFVIVDADTDRRPGLPARARAGDGRRGSRPCRASTACAIPRTSPAAGLRAAALACRHHLRPLGRTALGASCGLYGNGMAFAAAVLRGRGGATTSPRTSSSRWSCCSTASSSPTPPEPSSRPRCRPRSRAPRRRTSAGSAAGSSSPAATSSAARAAGRRARRRRHRVAAVDAVARSPRPAAVGARRGGRAAVTVASGAVATARRTDGEVRAGALRAPSPPTCSRARARPRAGVGLPVARSHAPAMVRVEGRGCGSRMLAASGRRRLGPHRSPR